MGVVVDGGAVVKDWKSQPGEVTVVEGEGREPRVSRPEPDR